MNSSLPVIVINVHANSWVSSYRQIAFARDMGSYFTPNPPFIGPEQNSPPERTETRFPGLPEIGQAQPNESLRCTERRGHYKALHFGTSPVSPFKV